MANLYYDGSRGGFHSQEAANGIFTGAMTRLYGWLLACPVVMGAAHRFAVYGHHLPGQQVCHRLAPLHEALLEPVRIQAGEHIPKVS